MSDSNYKTWQVMNDLDSSLIELGNIMTQIFDSKKIKQSSDYETIKSLRFVFDTFMSVCEDKMSTAWNTVITKHSHTQENMKTTYKEVTELLYDPIQEDYYLQLSDSILQELGWQVNEELELKVVGDTIVITKVNGK